MKTLVALVALIFFGRCLSAAEIVVPSVSPAYLPIGSTNAMLTWAVTNRQWSQNGKPLRTMTSWSIDFKAGSVDMSTTGLRPMKSFEDFGSETDMIVRNHLIPALKQRVDVDPDENLTLFVSHGYGDKVKKTGINSFSLRKSLGRLADMKVQPLLKGFDVMSLIAVVRVPGLEKFEIMVDDPGYGFSWPSRSAKPSGTYGTELTTSEYLVFNPWYSQGGVRARFKLTVAGVTREYTQAGYPLKPPTVRVISDSKMETTFTKGSDTVVEASSDLKNWSEIGRINWNQSKYGASRIGTEPADKMFFRARSF